VHDIASLHGHHDPVPRGFLELRRQVAALPDGERLAAVASRHFSEIRRLINTQRYVATMWHRAGGPRLLRGMLHGECGCCTAVGERELRYLERFVEQLEVFGSPRLRAALERDRAVLLALLPGSRVAA
jgi:hypothetical protein